MMRGLIFMALLLMPLSANAFSVSELVEDCKVCSEDFKTGKNSPQCFFCDGVLTGASSAYIMMEANKTVCPPKNLDTHRMRNMFRLWAKKNEDKAGEPAVWGVLQSLIEAYPCAR